MSDVFILNIDEDGQEIIDPIAQNLATYDISTYCDSEVVYEEGGFAGAMLKEFKNCLVFALVITEKCFEKILSIFDLNSKDIQNDKTIILPILHNVDIEKAKEKYPFLFEHEYITYNENMNEVVSQIKSTVEVKKEESSRNEIKNIIGNLKKYENEKLENISQSLEHLLDVHNSVVVIEEIYKIIEIIMLDIAHKENIYANISYGFKNVLKSGVIDKDIEDNIKQIITISSVYVSKPNVHENESLNKDIDMLVSNLGSIISWYVVSYFKTSLIKRKEVIPVYSNEITEEDLQDIYDIETLVFSEDIAGDADATKLSFMYNPFTIVGARDSLTGKVVAFINTYPITEGFYEKILSGNFDDTKITTEDIMKYNNPGFYKLYISSLCIHPKYNRTSAFGVVYKAFAEMIASLAKDKGVYVSEILADCATKKGATICRNIGMTEYTETSHGTMVYKLKLTKENLSEMKLLTRQGSEVLDLYNKKYN